LDLRLHEVGLFLDVDGTLLDLAPRPDMVEVPAALTRTLAAVERRLDGALALVSGRPIGELDRLFAPLRLRASGIHGAEMRSLPSAASRFSTQRRLPERAWLELVRLLDGFPGTLAENKRVSFAVHYRCTGPAAAELAAALRRFRDRFAELAVELIAGQQVYEIRLAGFDKGDAIRSFMAGAPFAGRCPVFIADDEMDRAGFDAAIALGGRAFSVGKTLAGVSGCFPRPQAVRDWLQRLVE
jgi:trehalose 6-phosphate phosphatase